MSELLDGGCFLIVISHLFSKNHYHKIMIEIHSGLKNTTPYRNLLGKSDRKRLQ